MIDISIITVGMNHLLYLKVLLRSLYKENIPQASIEMIYVDNCSSDGTVEYVRQNYPQVRIVENQKPLGFGENNNILGISNPAFELFLLLHYKDAYEKYIKPNEKEIISNEKVGNQRYIRNLFTQVSGINPKKNKSIGELVKQVDFAIVEECKINEDIHQCSGQVTCNIAKIINDIRYNKAI